MNKDWIQRIWGDFRNPNENDQTYLTKIKFDFHYALIWERTIDKISSSFGLNFSFHISPQPKLKRLTKSRKRPPSETHRDLIWFYLSGTWYGKIPFRLKPQFWNTHILNVLWPRFISVDALVVWDDLGWSEIMFQVSNQSLFPFWRNL